MQRTASLPLGRIWGVRAFANPRFASTALVVVAGLCAVALISYAFEQHPLLDLEAHLRGGARWLNGQDPYYIVAPANELVAPANDGFAYPPTMVPLFAVLSHLGLDWTTRLWQAVSLCALAWLLWEMAQPRTVRRLASLVILAVTFYPTMTNIGLGQTGLFTLAGTWAALCLGRRLAAGVSLAMASSFKLFPLAAAIPLALYGYWRTALVAVGAFTASIAVTWPWVSGLWPEYLQNILGHKLALVTVSPANQSLAAAMYRTFTANPYQYPLVVAPGLARALSTLLALSALLIAVGAAWTMKRGNAALGYGVVLTALPLALTNAWQHYYVLALPLLWLVAAEGVRRRDVWLLAGVVGAECMISIAAATVDHWYFLIAQAAPSVHGIYANASVLGGVVLLLAGVRLTILTLRERRPTASVP